MRTVNFFRHWLLAVPMFFLCVQGEAKNYYFSSLDGDDSRTTVQAQNSATPWKSLQKLDSIFLNLQPGDSVLFKRGEVFNGQLITKKSGSINLPIIVTAYGIGANPIISGFTTVNSWINLGNNIWESTDVVSTLATCNMVVVNGVNTPMGRYPNFSSSQTNGGYLTFESHSGATSIASSSLSGTPNWTGAEVVIRSSQFTLDRAFITSQSFGTIAFPAISVAPQNGYGFFIQNSCLTLDTANEWYYNPSTHKIRIYSAGLPVNVQVASQDVLTTVHGSYITFKNISFEGANSNAFLLDWGGTSNIQIQNCVINFSGINAIQVSTCHFANIQNCIIANSNIIGINLSYDTPYDTIRNNTISNTGIYAGMGQSGAGTYTGIQKTNPDIGLIIEYNRIKNTGYNGINFYGDSVIIKNNLIDSFCTVLQDGGGIYVYGKTSQGRKIIGNIVLNGIGATAGTNNPEKIVHGIYLDEGTANIEILKNSVANCSNTGIYLHNANNLVINGNTLYNNRAQIGTLHDPNAVPITNISAYNNIFFSKTSLQPVAEFISGSNDISLFGALDSNYYVRPIDDNIIISLSTNYWESFNFYTLAGWSSFSSFDKHSHKSPKAVTNLDDLRFEYNADSFSKTIILNANYLDAAGVNYNGSIILAPYSSAALIRNGAITTINEPPIADAGSSQVIFLGVNTCMLSGTGVDLDGNIISYLWTKLAGPPAIVISPDSSASLVTDLVAGNYIFQLRVTDNKAATAVDTVHVNVIEASDLLPLKVILFQGKYADRTTKLSWKTVNEQNVLKFDIQRMIDGTWNTIGSVPAARFSTESLYTFNDFFLKTGSNFYRLKIIDTDDNYTYSSTIMVELQKVENFVYQNVPNPFNTITSLQYEIVNAAMVKIIIYNEVGKQVAILVSKIQLSGNYQVLWNAERAASGNYFCTIMIGNKAVTKKMIKIKQ